MGSPPADQPAPSSGPADGAAPIPPPLRADEALDQLAGPVVMIVGPPGGGKTTVALRLAERLSERFGPAAIVAADVGQPLAGPPCCLSLVPGPSWRQPTAFWFGGAPTPGGNLLPVAWGAGRLVQRARDAGAQAVVVDTGGMIAGPAARALKYHKMLACQPDQLLVVVGGEQAEGVADLVRLLAAGAPQLVLAKPPPGARNRRPDERRRARQQRYAEYFSSARELVLHGLGWIEPDWTVRSDPALAPPGTLMGLLDADGFCLGLGVVRRCQPGRLTLATPCTRPDRLAVLRRGAVRLDPDQDWVESPLPATPKGPRPS